MNTLNILGPFESSFNYWIIVLSSENCILVKLDMVSTIKEMFFDYKKSLAEKGFQHIKENYRCKELNNKSIKVELVKSLNWKHYLSFYGEDLPEKISILNRKQVETYEKELGRVLKSNFSIKK